MAKKTRKSELEIDPQIEIETKSAVSRAEKREDTRSKIALYYVIGFMVVVALPLLIFIFRRELSVNDTRDLLLAISGILSGPLGFIIGYYFKAHSSER